MKRFICSSTLKGLIKLFVIFIVFTIAFHYVELFYNRTIRMQVADTPEIELQRTSHDTPKILRNSSNWVVLPVAGKHFVVGPES